MLHQLSYLCTSVLLILLILNDSVQDKSYYTLLFSVSTIHTRCSLLKETSAVNLLFNDCHVLPVVFSTTLIPSGKGLFDNGPLLIITLFFLWCRFFFYFFYLTLKKLTNFRVNQNWRGSISTVLNSSDSAGIEHLLVVLRGSVNRILFSQWLDSLGHDWHDNQCRRACIS